MSKPTPLSRTNTAGWPSQIIWSTWMVARWRGRVYLIAFKSRLANTCLIKPGSHSTVGRQPICHSISRSEEHTSELQSRLHLVCRLLLEKKKENPYPDSRIESM